MKILNPLKGVLCNFQTTHL